MQVPEGHRPPGGRAQPLAQTLPECARMVHCSQDVRPHPRFQLGRHRDDDGSPVQYMIHREPGGRLALCGNCAPLRRLAECLTMTFDNILLSQQCCGSG